MEIFTLKKDISIKILSIVCVLTVAFASNTFGVSAVVLEDSNSSYEFAGSSMEEFNGCLSFVDENSDNSFHVTERIIWEQDGNICELLSGDIIGICENQIISNDTVSEKM